MGKPSLHDVWKWIRGWKLEKTFGAIKNYISHTAVAVTEAVKTATEGQIAQTIATTIDEAMHTHFAEDALRFIHSSATKALAIELGITALPDVPTGDDIAKWEQEVYQTIAGKSESEKARIWTSYAAHLFQVLSDAVTSPTPLTWAQIVIIVENEYQAFKKAQESADAEPQ